MNKQLSFDYSNLKYNDEKLKKLIHSRTEVDKNFWDFKGVNTKEYTHGYHGYPAMMIPQIAREFIDITKEVSDFNSIFDPFMGSGTTLVEGLIQHKSVVGNDLNPLSCLISKVKTKPLNPKKLNDFIESWSKNLISEIKLYREKPFKVVQRPNFKNIEYWFKDYVIDELQIIKNYIKMIPDEDIEIKDFIWVVFSQTVRYVSNTRKNEFKLYRMEKEKLDLWNPDTLDIFLKYLKNNYKGNETLYSKVKNSKVHIYSMNAMNLEEIKDNSFDLLITSPPYGDSNTTVAYGQFSRLSLQWLDLEESIMANVPRIDRMLLGGQIISKDILSNINSETLLNTYNTLADIDLKRAREVYRFYEDLFETIKEVTRVMKKNSYQYWVVANRTVKGQILPTHEIIIELFELCNVKLVDVFNRNIPNKKMPRINSPSNKKGNTSETMTGEIILVFRKL